jgi:hypothetical protein
MPLDTRRLSTNRNCPFNAGSAKDAPSGLPHPDSALRIENASRELSIARQEMEQAHSRLILYLSRGILLEDCNTTVKE